MEKGLISIIVPVYNTKCYLIRCIKSITAQTYHHLEILLIDDGSTDGSGLLCDQLAKTDGRIRVIHKPNEGAGMARNTGLAYARGEYICFFDSDDRVTVDVIEKAYCLAQQEHSDIVVFGYYQVKKGTAPIPVIPNTDKTSYSGLEVQASFLPDLLGPDVKNGVFTNLFIGAWTFFSMELIQRTGWRFVSEREIISEDIYSQFCLYRAVKKVSVLKEPLYYYYESPGSLSHSCQPGRLQKINQFYSKCRETGYLYGYNGKVMERLSYQYLSLAIEYLKMIVTSNDSKANRRAMFQAAVHDPQLQKVLSELDFGKEKPARKLLLRLIQKKYLRLCCILVKAKARKDLYYV